MNGLSAGVNVEGPFIVLFGEKKHLGPKGWKNQFLRRTTICVRVRIPCDLNLR